MREHIIFFLLCHSYVLSLRHFQHYERISCDKVVTEDQGLILPTGASCDILIASKHGQKTTLDFFWEKAGFRCEDYPEAVQVVDANDNVLSACNGGETDSYLYTSMDNMSIRLKNLPLPVKAHVTFVPPVFRCADTVSFASMVGVPFIFEKDEEENVNCPLILPSGLIIDIETLEPHSGRCDVRVEVTQGRGRFRPTQSTGQICIGHEKLTTEIYCGAGIMYLFGSKGTKVQVTLSSPTKKQARSFFFKRSSCAV